MKKVLSAILAASMIFGMGTITKAAGTDTQLTPEQQTARQNFLQAYRDKMVQLTDLRAQTKTAVENNNNAAKQIKDAVNGAKNNQQTKDAIATIKATLDKDKTLIAQAKDLNSQRAEVRQQFKDAVKAGDTAAAQAAKDKITALNSQIESIRQQVKANQDTVKPLKDQVKAYRDALKAKKAQVDPLQQQAKDLRTKISDAEKAKNQLWVTFKSDVQAKNYDAALTTLQSIIDAKANILNDIKARGDLLSQITAIVNPA